MENFIWQKPECETWAWLTNDFGENLWKSQCAGRDGHHNTWVLEQNVVSGRLRPCPYGKQFIITSNYRRICLPNQRMNFIVSSIVKMSMKQITLCVRVRVDNWKSEEFQSHKFKFAFKKSISLLNRRMCSFLHFTSTLI